MKVIGLTGGIGSGKSTVCGMLADLGAAVIDADKLGHEAYEPNNVAWQAVIATFGEGILRPNQEIDRRKLAEIVFADQGALDKLNQIMHPLMHRMMELKLESLREQGASIVVLEAAVLIEAGWTDLVDQVWVTLAPEETVIQRLCSKKGFTAEQVKARISAQMPISQRASHADVVINTDCDLNAVRTQVDNLWHKLQSQRLN